MRLWHIPALFGLVIALNGCRTSLLFRADESVDHAKKQVDDSVDRASDRIQRLVNEAEDSLKDTLKESRIEYQGALQETSAEVNKLREDLKKDLAELDRRSQERIEQIRTSAIQLIEAGDKAAQTRIDQVFTELRTFMADTLERITRLIQPVLVMADKVAGLADQGNKAVQDILARLLGIFDSVKSTIEEVKKAIQQVRGINPQTGEQTTGGILGILSMILTGAIALWRKLDQGKNGDRWKPEELKAKTVADVETEIKNGTFDDEIAGRINSGVFDSALRARLVDLGVLRVSTAVPSREGGDPSSPSHNGEPANQGPRK